MASTSLTGIFAPGSPPLNESLRTLVLDPKRAIAPGETIRVEFTFSNLGGAPATGVRVRFSQPQGVTHLEDADVVDGVPLTDGEHFVDATGAATGDLEPNSQRRVSCSYRVNDAIEGGTDLAFQAALVTDQTPLVGSNIERITVRSRPELRGSGTMVTIAAPPEPKPGDVITVRAVVANTGASSAHSVVVTMPAPENTSYVSHSARIDGRLVAGIAGEAFDYGEAVVASERLGAGQSVTIEYQATIDSPLPDATRIKAIGSLASRETGEFPLVSSEIVVASPVDFATDDTAFEVLAEDVVAPGTRVPMVARIVNAGTGIADGVNISFSLPRGLVYSPGSAHLDGQPIGDVLRAAHDDTGALNFALGTFGAGRVAELGLDAVVAVPHGGDTSLPVEALLRWKGGSRSFSRRLSMRVAPRFNRARNFVETDRSVAQARDEVQFRVHVYNDGTAAEDDAVLRLVSGAYLQNLRVAERDGEAMPYGEPLALGVVEPHDERVFTVTATVGSRVPDRSNVTLGVVLDVADGTLDAGTATILVRSHPQLEASSVVWERASNEPLQPNHTAEVVVRFRNSGTDVLRDARLAFSLPPELAIDRAIEARRDRDGLYFGDVPADTAHEARFTVRLVRAVARNESVVVTGWLHGRGVNPVQLADLEIVTHAQPEFASNAQFVVAPPENVNAAERVHYEIRLRNDGDGPADRLAVRVVPTNLAVYVPGSTSINDHVLPDEAGASPLWAPRGLVLADVNPGVDLRVRWEMVVMSPLAAGTPLDTRAVLEWGDGQTLAVVAPTLRVQAQPSMSESTAGAPFSVARLLPEEAQAAPPTHVSVPPAVETAQAREPEPKRESLPTAIADVIARSGPALETPRAAVPHETEPAQPAPALYLDLSTERLANTIRMIERSEAGGLIQHLFAMRMLLPENAVGAPPQVGAAFATASRALRAPLERFFVRLKMPRLTITAKDLEDRESRDALRSLVESLGEAPRVQSWRAPQDVVRLVGQIDAGLVRAIVTDLESSPLGAAAPWLVNAHLLGSTIEQEGTISKSLGAYRDELIKVFTVLSELPIDEFHRVLTTSVNRTLDDSLASVLDALRGAAHLAVE